MKLLRLPTKNGLDWWIVTHSFWYKEPNFKNVLPIHILTFLTQELVTKNKDDVMHLGLSLENKLFAVKHNLDHLRSSLSKVGDPIYDGVFEKDYFKTQEVIADLEAYLGAIYSVLEITAQLNCKFDPSLPQGFRKQAKKYKMFSFLGKPWLRIFYDLRTELAHYNSLLPVLREGCILIEFRNAAQLVHFEKGKYKITFKQIFNIYVNLIRLLNKWAEEKLKSIDKNSEYNIWEFNEITQKMSTVKIKIKNLIKLSKSKNLNNGKFELK